MFKNRNIVRDFPFFTHFATIPFLAEHHHQAIQAIQRSISQQLGLTQQSALQLSTLQEGSQQTGQYSSEPSLKEHSNLLAHLTLFKLTASRAETKQQIIQICNEKQPAMQEILRNCPITFDSIKYFTRLNKSHKKNQLTVVYLSLHPQTVATLNQAADVLIRSLLAAEVIVPEELKAMNVFYDHHSSRYCPEQFHLTLFRARNILQTSAVVEAFARLAAAFKPLQLPCEQMHISTMQQFQDGFYLPLTRMPLTKQSQKEATGQSE